MKQRWIMVTKDLYDKFISYNENQSNCHFHKVRVCSPPVIFFYNNADDKTSDKSYGKTSIAKCVDWKAVVEFDIGTKENEYYIEFENLTKYLVNTGQ